MRLWDLSPSVWRYNGTPMEILHLSYDESFRQNTVFYTCHQTPCIVHHTWTRWCKIVALESRKCRVKCTVHVLWLTRVSIILWTKSFHHFCVLLCHIGFHINTVICLKIATSLKQSRDCSIMSIYSTNKFQYCCRQKITCNLNKAFLCSVLGHMGFHRNTVECLKIAASLKQNPILLNNVNNVHL